MAKKHLGSQLGSILVAKGYITQDQVDAAVAVTKDKDLQLGEVLVQWSWITEEQLMNCLHAQAPPPPPPPLPPPPPVQQGYIPAPLAPDLTMDTVQSSKFRIDLKTLIYVGSLLVSGVGMYFTFMSELNTRFDDLEDVDNSAMVELEKKFTELQNTFTPIGEGIYAVDPLSTWPPSRGEYKMKDEMSRTMLIQIQKDIDQIKKDIEKIERKVYNGGN